RVHERADRERIPARQDLLVSSWLDATLARGEQLPSGLAEQLFDFTVVAPEQTRQLRDRQLRGKNCFALRMAGLGEISQLVDVVVATGDLRLVGVEKPIHLGLVPQEELPLLPLAVGVLGRIESAFGVAHLALHVGERLYRDAAIKRIAGRAEAVEV